MANILTGPLSMNASKAGIVGFLLLFNLVAISQDTIKNINGLIIQKIPSNIVNVLNKADQGKLIIKEGEITASMKLLMDTIFHGKYSFHKIYPYGRIGSDMPFLKIIFILSKDDLLFVSYEKGGRGGSRNLCIFDINEKTIVFHGSLNGDVGLNNCQEFMDNSSKAVFLTNREL